MRFWRSAGARSARRIWRRRSRLTVRYWRCGRARSFLFDGHRQQEGEIAFQLHSLAQLQLIGGSVLLESRTYAPARKNWATWFVKPMRLTAKARSAGTTLH